MHRRHQQLVNTKPKEGTKHCFTVMTMSKQVHTVDQSALPSSYHNFVAQLGMMSMTPLLCLIRDANEDSTCQSAYQKKKSRIEDLHEKIHAHKSKDATFTSFEKVHTHTHTHTNKTLVSVLTFNILPASPTNMQEIRMISKIIQMFKVFVFVVSYTIPSVKAHCPNISDFINEHLDSELAGCRGAGGGTPACTSLIYRAQSSRL